MSKNNQAARISEVDAEQGQNKLGFWEFDPGSSFFHLRSVRVSLVAIPTIAITLAVIIMLFEKENLQWDLSAHGVNYLVLTVWKVPVGILALLIPIVAILAANHRSVQSKETMRLSREQNVFANYYKHREEFAKYIAGLNVGFTLSTYELYSSLYRESEVGDWSFSPDFVAVVRAQVNRLTSMLESLGSVECQVINDNFLDEPVFIRGEINALFRFEVEPAMSRQLIVSMPIHESRVEFLDSEDALTRVMTDLNQLLGMADGLRKIFEFSYSNYRKELKPDYELLYSAIKQVNSRKDEPHIDLNGTIYS